MNIIKVKYVEDELYLNTIDCTRRYNINHKEFSSPIFKDKDFLEDDKRYIKLIALMKRIINVTDIKNQDKFIHEFLSKHSTGTYVEDNNKHIFIYEFNNKTYISLEEIADYMEKDKEMVSILFAKNYKIDGMYVDEDTLKEVGKFNSKIKKVHELISDKKNIKSMLKIILDDSSPSNIMCSEYFMKTNSVKFGVVDAIYGLKDIKTIKINDEKHVVLKDLFDAINIKEEEPVEKDEPIIEEEVKEEVASDNVLISDTYILAKNEKSNKECKIYVYKDEDVWYIGKENVHKLFDGELSDWIIRTRLTGEKRKSNTSYRRTLFYKLDEILSKYDYIKIIDDKEIEYIKPSDKNTKFISNVYAFIKNKDSKNLSVFVSMNALGISTTEKFVYDLEDILMYKNQRIYIRLSKYDEITRKRAQNMVNIPEGYEFNDNYELVEITEEAVEEIKEEPAVKEDNSIKDMITENNAENVIRIIDKVLQMDSQQVELVKSIISVI